MQILDKDIRVNFTSIENQALRNGLDVVTRLASNISGDADTTSDIGVNAVSARDAINYLLSQGGSDNSLEVMSPYEGLIVTQEQMATLEEAKKILQGLISPASDDPGQDWWYLGLDLELPVDIGTENSPLIVTYEPDSLRIYKNRLAATGTLPYRLDFTFTGTDSTLYKVKQVINYTESTNSQTNITTGTWVVSGNPTYQKYENGTWSTISVPASTIWPVSTGGQPATIGAAPTQYVAVLNKGGFNPNGAYNWISERSNITDAARELYDLYINVLNNYTVSDVEQFPTYTLGTWTWTDMPFKNIPIVFSNNSHTFSYEFERDDETNSGTLTGIVLPKETVDGTELPYHITLGEGSALDNDLVKWKTSQMNSSQNLDTLFIISEADTQHPDWIVGSTGIFLEAINYKSITLTVNGTGITGSLTYRNESTGTELKITKDSGSASITKVVPSNALTYTLVDYNNMYPSVQTLNFSGTNNITVTVSAITTSQATLTLRLDNSIVGFISGSYLINNIEYWITPNDLGVKEIPVPVIKVGNEIVNLSDITVMPGPNFALIYNGGSVESIEVRTNIEATLTTNFS